ncbi:MAG: amidohydrolase family protein, partial [Myxococcales bacterium]|nr:amidohydrolase family protein [Myxococcales bacterium]
MDGALALRPAIEVDADGTIVAIRTGTDGSDEGDESDAAGPRLRYDLGRRLLLPGLVNGHSHAFQRVIRGATHRRRPGDPSDFWSWREAMYAAVQAFDPEGLFAATRACYREMLASGITCVGEFHYVHHQA